MKNILFLAAASLMSLLSYAQEQTKVYMVSNAHFDSQWNWDVQRSISEFIPKTIERNLFLLEKYPEYLFNFEGGVKYAWMKEYYPEYWEQIRKYVDQRRWHISGSTWDANDPNIPSIESFTRNILYGQHFYRDEFGVQGTDIFLPDCFGFGWTLPTAAAHSGLIGFSTQKLSWRNNPFYGDSKIPFDIGFWEGVDGSRIMIAADARKYSTKWKDEDLSRSAYLQELGERNPDNVVYHYYGVGDTGGSPTIQSVRTVQKSVLSDGPVRIISADSDRMFKDYLPYEDHPDLPVWKSELLMDVHATGCYTSQAAMKLFNRRNELLADAAERSAVIADWAGTSSYPKEFLTDAWKRFIWHQFHDDITGTSIPRAYEFSWNDELISMKHFANVMTASVGAFSRLLDTQVKGTPVVVYNPVGNDNVGLVEISYDGMPENAVVYGPDGRRVPSQMTVRDGVRKLVFKASVSPVGYAVYDVRKSSVNVSASSALAVSEKGMENSVYRLAFDANGDICSIWDKRNDRELVEQGKAVRLALFTENKSYKWPAWEILKETIDAEPVAVSEDVRINVVEEGPLRVTVCVERKWGDSVFRQYVSLTDGTYDDRIDIVNDVFWQSTDALLKAEFPLSVFNEKAVYDLGVGTISRGNNTMTSYEVYAQQWAEIADTDGSYAVAVMNDSKYGWDKPSDNTLRLTLLHTPSTNGNYAYQSSQDFGRHVFTYSIAGHQGDYRQGDVVQKAEMLNQPLQAFVATKHKGTYGRSFTFAQPLNENVALRALKQAEDSDAYVVRFYETSGLSSQNAGIRFAADILEAKELNGNEQEIGPASVSGNTLDFEIGPYGMKTYLVRLAKPQSPGTMVSAPVDLPFDKKTASYNPFRIEVNFDGAGNSYAAELIPETLSFKGIDFNLGDPTVANALKCKGNKIALPKGNYNKLYLLASAMRNDTRCTFAVGGKAQEVTVPYYAGFIGQWGHTGHTEEFLKAADVAYVGTHRHSMTGNRDLPYDYSYMFCIPLDIPAGADSFTLPDNSQVVVFAATAVLDVNNVAVPCSDLFRIGMPASSEPVIEGSYRNLCAGKPLVARSGEINRREVAEFAVDDDIDTKWCDVSETMPKYIEIDLQEVSEIKGWSVLHAGVESQSYITKEYSLQVRSSQTEPWKTVDTVYENDEYQTDRRLKEPVQARYVRLDVTKADQNDGIKVRIYEFAVY